MTRQGWMTVLFGSVFLLALPQSPVSAPEAAVHVAAWQAGRLDQWIGTVNRYVGFPVALTLFALAIRIILLPLFLFAERERYKIRRMTEAAARHGNPERALSRLYDRFRPSLGLMVLPPLFQGAVFIGVYRLFLLSPALAGRHWLWVTVSRADTTLLLPVIATVVYGAALSAISVIRTGRIGDRWLAMMGAALMPVTFAFAPSGLVLYSAINVLILIPQALLIKAILFSDTQTRKARHGSARRI